MSLQTFQFVLLSSLSLSFFLGNSILWAENNGVVVPPTSDPSTKVPTPSTNTTSTTSDNKARFSCQLYDSKYTVMYQPPSQQGKYFAWATPTELGGGWYPQKRCEAIASRLESYRPDGLQEMQTAIENRENIICVTSKLNSFCRIVLTVPHGKDPIDIRNRVFQNLTTADTGQSTIAVDTYANDGRGTGDNLYQLGRSVLGRKKNQGINLQPFLDPKDGGTGKQLDHGIAIGQQNQRGRGLRLNPDISR